MKSITARLLSALMLLACSLSYADETIVMLRHAEKPEAGLGQLSCQGLNRALALPRVLRAQFATPAALFAPNPGQRKADKGVSYNYLRPLATLEPTAISLGLPVNTDIGYNDIAGLQRALLAPQLADATVLVAWEHHWLESAARELLAHNGGNPAEVPEWQGPDFDSVYVVTLRSDRSGQRTATFRVEHQGLTNLPTSCPF